MVNQKIYDYIMKEEMDGYSPSKLRNFLIKKGYNQDDVDEAISAVMSEAENEINKNASTSETSIEKQISASQQGGLTGTGSTSKPIRNRNPWLMLLFTILTLGIFGLVWLIMTNIELQNHTKTAPSPWLLFGILIPVVNVIVVIYYSWKYCKAVNELTGFNNVLLFVLMILIGPVGLLITQMELNKKAA